MEYGSREWFKAMGLSFSCIGMVADGDQQVIPKCRYTDCKEHNEIAGDDEQITCYTCRDWMGLPTLDEDEE